MLKNKKEKTNSEITEYLNKHLGEYVLCDFLLNTKRIKRQGILEKVENDHIILYDTISDMKIICYIRHLEFLYILNEYSRPKNNYNQIG